MKRQLNGRTHITLANCGTSPAQNIKLHRILKSDKESKQQDRVISVLEHLYPGQDPTISMSPIHTGCTAEQMVTLQALKKRGAKMAPEIPKDKQDLLTLELELIYDDIIGKPRTVPYHFEYNYRLDKWVPAGFGFE